MGPLVPFIFSNEFNLIIALIAGIGFGFTLEQAGFSSTKKLVGLFYGYDFTVLKVFFTAGITAMIGVVLLAHFGLLDLSLIYINPTFLKSALVGGAIMGLGFIIGGFCPGTSVCAASIGKLDGLAFVFGSALGVMVFVEGYPLFEKIYLADAWGPVLINEKLGMSKLVFAFLLTAFAVIAFYATRIIENRVNGVQVKLPKEKVIIYSSAVGVAFLVLFIIAISPDSKTRLESRINRELQKKDVTSVMISPDKLANEIVNNYYKINIVDVRSPEAFKAYHLPFAINIPLEKMSAREWKTILKQKHKANYFYADNQQDAKKAYLFAVNLGNADNYILSEPAIGFKKMFTDLVPPAENTGKNEQNIYNFRRKAATDMATLVEALKNSSQPVEAKATKIKGGC
ncbi:MAG TPA: YeeE/YedE thiosulfate transporter family protein [Prolixibacteraceae bacterium]|nr:YeeE/YedE thiosulfate transporter family protein [Prolixibacteraceae bacterium]